MESEEIVLDPPGIQRLPGVGSGGLTSKFLLALSLAAGIRFLQVFPWGFDYLAWSRELRTWGLGPLLAALLLVGPGAAVVFRALRRSYRWTGRAVLRDSGLEVVQAVYPCRWAPPLTDEFSVSFTLWSQVQSYDDRDPRFLVLDSCSGPLYLPTPSPSERVSVLALLDERGLGRST